MILENINFECITPCFCAGAEQSKKEIRPSAIRGALRWWFRCLGGTSVQEINVFGGVDPVKASSLQIRVSNVFSRPLAVMPKPASETPKSYILHFASIAGGSSSRFGDGPRWNVDSCFGPGTTFTLHIRQLRSLSADERILLTKAIQSFKHYGSIGLRVTRGLGAVQASCADSSSFEQTDKMLMEQGFTVRRSNKAYKVWDTVLEEAGKWLKNDLRKEFGAGGNKKPAQATPLGSIKPSRQTSSVYLRPIQLDGNLIFSAFEAPHDKVLGSASKIHGVSSILKDRDFTLPAPT